MTTKAKPAVQSKPWLSGHCNTTNPAEIHRQCHEVREDGKRCRCACHPDPDRAFRLSERCGRVDDHGWHEWLGRDHGSIDRRIVRTCPGNPVIEGGHPL